MFTLIKEAHIFSPKELGVLDLLLCNDRIIEISKGIQCHNHAVHVIHASEKILIPGIIDQHIHITGGGGEGSFKTRVPEIMLGSLIQGGVTTVVGLLGTDSTTRSVENLLAKTKALREEGITAFCLTGSYDYPSPTITGTVKKDITFIDEILGAKLALSDHRAPLITKSEFKKLASDVRVAGMLSGKHAYITLHMGNGAERFSVINEILAETEVPIAHFRPTHVGRCTALFDEAMNFAKKGGIIDITASDRSNALPLSDLITLARNNHVPLANITISSDGNGSWSTYDKAGMLQKIGCFPCDTVYKTIKHLIEQKILTFEEAVSLGTSNVAHALHLKHRGVLAEGGFADMLLIDKQFNIDTVIVNGTVMMAEKTLIKKGTYET